jgi:hypothetical protein
LTIPKSVKCGICGKRFRTIGALSHHRRKDHPNAKRKAPKRIVDKSSRRGDKSDGFRVERSPHEIHIHIQ